VDSRQCPLSRRLAGRFDVYEFVCIYGNGMSKESDSLSFNENLFAHCVEESNISRPDFVAFPDSARLLAPESNIHKRDISEIIVNRELSRNVATEYFTPELTDMFRC